MDCINRQKKLSKKPKIVLYRIYTVINAINVFIYQTITGVYFFTPIP